MKVLDDRSDVRSLVFIAALLLLIGLQWCGAARDSVLYAATLWLSFVACIVNHNHQHCATFCSAVGNRLFGILLTFSIGQPATAIVPMHNHNHHPHNNSAHDYVRVSQVTYRWNLLNLLLFPFVAVKNYAAVKSQQMRQWRRLDPRLFAQLRWERTLFYPTLLLLVFARPVETVQFCILPYLFGQWSIIAINLVQHDGCDAQSRHNHSRNFTGRWLNWWTLNNGYHTAHHMRPQMHWSRLPTLHAEIQASIHPKLRRGSLLWTLFQFYLWPGRRAQVAELRRPAVRPSLSASEAAPECESIRLGQKQQHRRPSLETVGSQESQNA